jgi:hypothetical protein
LLSQTQRAHRYASEAEYTLVYERKMHAKKLAETEGAEAALQKASDDTLAAAKKSLTEVLRAVEDDILVPALAKPAALAAALCTTVAEGTYPAAGGAAAAAADDAPAEEGGESIAATLKHADSDEFHANRFKGLGSKDAMEMARKKYAEMKVQYKGVALPAEFKETEKQLGLHKTHLYAITHKAASYGKKSIPTVFAPDKDVLKDTLAKLPGFTNLKQAVNDLAGKVAAAQEAHAGTFLAAVEAAGGALSGLVEADIKECKDAALQYEGSVYKWKVAKDRIAALAAEEAKAKEAGKAFDDKKQGGAVQG